MIWHGSQQQMVFDNHLDKSVASDSPKGKQILAAIFILANLQKYVKWSQILPVFMKLKQTCSFNLRVFCDSVAK
jgi:hypothetical protein